MRVRYLFYRIFLFQHNFVGEDKVKSAFTAVLTIVMFWGLNLFSVYVIYDTRFNLSFIFEGSIPKQDIIVPLIPATIFAIISYFMFFAKSKHKTIISKIENRNPKINKIYNILAILYQIISFLFFIAAFVYAYEYH